MPANMVPPSPLGAGEPRSGRPCSRQAHSVFGLPQDFVRSAVMTAAMAPGVNTCVFASMYARGQAQAASSVLLATGLLVLTASAWLALLGGVG